MPEPFLSSEEFDERAHALYNEGRYDDALDLLREGLQLYPQAVELHVGMGYARLARDEFAWARRSFEEALILDPEHEDGLAGLGEVLLKLGQPEAGMRQFDRILLLGYEDDVDLMLQVGRALFREGFVETSLEFFRKAVQHAPESAEPMACLGYAQHRLGRDQEAQTSLRTALRHDPTYAEARVYLANILYDAEDLEGALREFERTEPVDHWDELGIFRVIELKKTLARGPEPDDSIAAWEARLVELTDEPDPLDAMLAEIEQTVLEREVAAEAAADAAQEADLAAPREEHEALEALGSLLTGLVGQASPGATPDAAEAVPDAHPGATGTDLVGSGVPHRIELPDGSVFEGSWLEIVERLRDAREADRSVAEYMVREARRFYGATGASVASDAPEAFLRDSAAAGMLRIVH